MSALESRTLVGPPKQVGAAVDRLVSANLLVTMGPPQEHEQGMRIQVVVRKQAAVPNSTALALPAGSRPASRRRPLSRRERQAIKVGSALAAAATGVAAVVWLLVRAASAAAGWTAANPAVMLLAAAAVLVAGLLWITRRFGQRTTGGGGGSGCPGLIQHCNGCKDHR